MAAFQDAAVLLPLGSAVPPPPPGAVSCWDVAALGAWGAAEGRGTRLGLGLGLGSPCPCITWPPSHTRAVDASTHEDARRSGTPLRGPLGAVGLPAADIHRPRGRPAGLPVLPSHRAGCSSAFGAGGAGREEHTVPLHIDALRQGLHSDCGSAGPDPDYGAPLSVAGGAPAPSPCAVPGQQCPYPHLGICGHSTSAPHTPLWAAPLCLGELSTERGHNLSAAAVLVVTRQRFAEQKRKSARPDLQLLSELLRRGCWSLAGYRNAAVWGCARLWGSRSCPELWMGFGCSQSKGFQYQQMVLSKVAVRVQCSTAEADLGELRAALAGLCSRQTVLHAYSTHPAHIPPAQAGMDAENKSPASPEQGEMLPRGWARWVPASQGTHVCMGRSRWSRRSRRSLPHCLL